MTDTVDYTPPAADDTYQVDYDYFAEAIPEPFDLLYGGRVFLKKLNEGERCLFQNKTNRDITVKKTTGDAQLKLSPGDERTELLKLAIVGWEGINRPFNKTNLELFLDLADTDIIDAIEKEVRARNKWLTTEMTVDEIDTEITRLKELRDLIEAREAGKGTS